MGREFYQRPERGRGLPGVRGTYLRKAPANFIQLQAIPTGRRA
jgi:hypothetical protein